MTEMKLPKLWTETELAAYFGVSPETIARERRRGRLKFTKVARMIRFTDGQVIEYINGRECAADEAKEVAKLKVVK